ncbi:MAG: hypothetical protein HS115_18275 [Spirochaetales bacterium]|nr:hypothetical protein [Spirochaetales bacterium]
MKSFWIFFLILFAVSAQPFWEKDARSRAAREILITIPFHLDAWLVMHDRPLQFYGFSSHSKRIQINMSKSQKLERTLKQLLLTDEGFYNILFLARAAEMDAQSSRFLLPAIQLSGVPYTLVALEKGDRSIWIEAESRGPDGKVGTFIRFPVEQIFLYFKPDESS